MIPKKLRSLTGTQSDIPVAPGGKVEFYPIR
jgi:hypothetical protein